MKIRSGFVSNSSSSSFCVFGAEVSEDELIDLVRKQGGFDPEKYKSESYLDKNMREAFQESKTEDDLIEYLKDDGVFWDLVNTGDLHFEHPSPDYGWDNGFIGLRYTSFTQEANRGRTVNEIIAEAEKKLTDLLGRPVTAKWYAGETAG